MEYIDAVLQAAHEREKYAKGSATRILNFLRELEIDTAAKLAARIDRMSAADKINFIRGRSRGQYSTERLQRLLDAIKDMSREWRVITEDNFNLSAKELAAVEIQLQAESLKLAGVLGEGISLQSVIRAAYAQPLLAQPLKSFFSEQEASVRKTITNSLRRSFVAGETVEQTVDSLIGTKAFKYKDGDLRKHRNGVRSVARTGLNHISTVTTRETFRALGVEKWIFLATLDSRTSKICGGLSHTEWKLSNNNAPFPPRHFNCRSVMMWGDEPLEGTQAANMSAPGQVDAKYNYEQLLKRQPVQWQRQQFTATQWKLWRSGKVSIRQLSDIKGTRTLTDIELRARYDDILNRINDVRLAA